ncbi:uncharacterized protein BT62DRAFT_951443 [Guyanagaster necrorhizus]|uniref:Glycosyltransferase 61 catalytic domain-containing protein n=1 Tax=Guyanagaster necrorhizus TaxID=856835 RepID=A0A9P8ARE1_9AGAR|nr:uncharacterized protein BT62DRAFT_951443 [Guyanagaster necrorhizus MCA 3950]KAG7445099.1 hypothetical protein BT62DRAFT_951443 [Guyanagaster necrorhizus MCA 3950]
MAFRAIRRTAFMLLVMLSVTLYITFHDFLIPNQTKLPPKYVYTAGQESHNLAEYFQLSIYNGTTSRPSAYWAPFSLSNCTFGLPPYYAPCVAQRLPKQVLYAEELLYPAFEIRQPYFATSEHRAQWRKAAMSIKERGVLQANDWLVYKGQSGQNFVFENVTYLSPKSYDRWSDDACMAKLGSSEGIQPFDASEVLARPKPPSIYGTALVALSPESFAFQHHLDHITHIIAQGSHLTYGPETPYVITGRQGNGFVKQLWKGLGFDDEHVLYRARKDILANRMIFSCRTVLVHPWLSLKTLEAFGIDYMKPSPTRNKILYMSRSERGIHMRNRGRRVLNEPELLSAIEAYLAERGKDEEVVIFSEGMLDNVPKFFKWCNENVMAVIGPHGGAMYHHRWAARGTVVIEMMPTSYTSMTIYEEASVLSQTYAVLVVEPSSQGGTNMIINPVHVVSLLQRHLGVPMRTLRRVFEEDPDGDESHLAEDPLRISYQWGGKELGL